MREDHPQHRIIPGSTWLDLQSNPTKAGPALNSRKRSSQSPSSTSAIHLCRSELWYKRSSRPSSRPRQPFCGAVATVAALSTVRRPHTANSSFGDRQPVPRTVQLFLGFRMMNGGEIKKAAINQAKKVASSATNVTNGNGQKKRRKGTDLKPIITTDGQPGTDSSPQTTTSNNTPS